MSLKIAEELKEEVGIMVQIAAAMINWVMAH